MPMVRATTTCRALLSGCVAESPLPVEGFLPVREGDSRETRARVRDRRQREGKQWGQRSKQRMTTWTKNREDLAGERGRQQSVERGGVSRRPWGPWLCEGRVSKERNREAEKGTKNSSDWVRVRESKKTLDGPRVVETRIGPKTDPSPTQNRRLNQNSTVQCGPCRSRPVFCPFVVQTEYWIVLIK